MPVLFRHRGFRFVFYANEGRPRKPIHVHALKNGLDAKFWLWPDIVLAYNDGHPARELREIIDLLTQRKHEITGAWHEFCGQGDDGPLR